MYNIKNTRNNQKNACKYDAITTNCLIVLNWFLIIEDNNWKHDPINWGKEFKNAIWKAENWRNTKKADKNAAYKSADVAVATCGTVSVDLAVARVPYITAKKVSFLSYLIAKILVKIKFINMINILI